MGTMKIIGLTGRARCGKDTLAGMIEDVVEFGYRISFAGPIRQFVAKITGLSVAELTDGPLKETPITDFGGRSPRQMMQTLGTEWGRELVDENLWITVARKQIEWLASRPAKDRPTVVVISDVRFENEAAMIRGLGGVVVHVHRPGAAAVNAHVSEAGVAFGLNDIEVQNVAGLDYLQAVAKSLVASG